MLTRNPLKNASYSNEEGTNNNIKPTYTHNELGCAVTALALNQDIEHC